MATKISGENIKEDVESAGLGILTAAVIFLVILFSLNYFNILSLSALSPKLFGFLPHRPIAEKQTGKNKPVANGIITIGCPVPKEFCSQGKIITYQGKLVGMGFTLPKGTAVLAAFKGTVSEGSRGGGTIKIKNHPVRWLEGQGDLAGYIAAYDFFAETVPSYLPDGGVKVFSQNEKLGTITSDSYPAGEPFASVNLIFTINQGNKYGEPLPFEKVKFQL